MSQKTCDELIPCPTYEEICEEAYDPPALDEDTRAQAIAACQAAIDSYYQQTWYQTAFARIRFALFWATYWVRLKLAMFLVLKLGWDDHKTWRRLGL